MVTKHEKRAEKTKQSILAAAEHLFAKRTFEDVTMRDIAKRAGCSHTTIYIYFKDKEDLLNQLATGPLLSIKRELELILAEEALPPGERLRLFSREFVHFVLANRTMYSIFFVVRPTRVDEKDPALEVQRLRNSLFELVGKALKEALEIDLEDDVLLAYTRSYFFLLHGIVASYATSEASVDALFQRLGSTFDLAFESMLMGVKGHLRKTSMGS